MVQFGRRGLEPEFHGEYRSQSGEAHRITGGLSVNRRPAWYQRIHRCADGRPHGGAKQRAGDDRIAVLGGGQREPDGAQQGADQGAVPEAVSSHLHLQHRFDRHIPPDAVDQQRDFRRPETDEVAGDFVTAVGDLHEDPGEVAGGCLLCGGAAGGQYGSHRDRDETHSLSHDDYFLPRRLNPVSTLRRTPAPDGTTATLNGMLTTPERRVTPAAIASAVPAGVMLGPMPNSAPLLVRRPTIQLRLGIAWLCSRPPRRPTHSVTAVNPPC